MIDTAGATCCICGQANHDTIDQLRACKAKLPKLPEREKIIVVHDR